MFWVVQRVWDLEPRGLGFNLNSLKTGTSSLGVSVSSYSKMKLSATPTSRGCWNLHELLSYRPSTASDMSQALEQHWIWIECLLSKCYSVTWTTCTSDFKVVYIIGKGDWNTCTNNSNGREKLVKALRHHKENALEGQRRQTLFTARDIRKCFLEEWILNGTGCHSLF